MEIKFTSESGYAQPTHKENEKSVLWQVWSVWPKEMPTKKLETKGSRWFYNRSQNCQFWWKNWVTLWIPSLGMSNKFHLLKLSEFLTSSSIFTKKNISMSLPMSPMSHPITPFPRAFPRFGKPSWATHGLRQLQVLHQLPHGRRLQGPTDSGQEQLQPVVFLAGETVTLHGKCRVIPIIDENRWDLTHIYESPITSC